MDTNLLAWAGGLFDGEGSIFVTRSQKCMLRMALVMIDKETVERFRTIVGTGRMSSFHRGGNCKDTWHWQAVSKEAIYVIKLLSPYLFTKAKQVALALEYGEKCNPGERLKITEEILMLRQLIAEDLSKLNQ